MIAEPGDPFGPWEEESDEPEGYDDLLWNASGSERLNAEESEKPVHNSGWRVAGLEDDSTPMMTFFEALTNKLAPPPQPSVPEEEKEPVPPQYPNAVIRFRDWCRHVYRRALGGQSSSPAWEKDWWAYPEARARIDAI